MQRKSGAGVIRILEVKIEDRPHEAWCRTPEMPHWRKFVFGASFKLTGSDISVVGEWVEAAAGMATRLENRVRIELAGLECGRGLEPGENRASMP